MRRSFKQPAPVRVLHQRVRVGHRRWDCSGRERRGHDPHRAQPVRRIDSAAGLHHGNQRARRAARLERYGADFGHSGAEQRRPAGADLPARRRRGQQRVHVLGDALQPWPKGTPGPITIFFDGSRSGNAITIPAGTWAFTNEKVVFASGPDAFSLTDQTHVTCANGCVISGVFYFDHMNLDSVSSSPVFPLSSGNTSFEANFSYIRASSCGASHRHHR